MSIELVMLSNHLTLCRPLLFLPSVFPSIKVFSSESNLHIRWPEYWSFSFSISLSSEYSELFSFRIDCFDLLAVQGTLKSLLQHHSLKASILWISVVFMTQISHLYVTTGKKTPLWLYWSLSAKWCLCFLILLYGFVLFHMLLLGDVFYVTLRQVCSRSCPFSVLGVFSKIFLFYMVSDLSLL